VAYLECEQDLFESHYKRVSGLAMKWLADLLYPRQCFGCGASAPQDFRYFCWDCWADIQPLEPPFCHRCGDPVSGAVEHEFVCYACSATPPFFTFARSSTRYAGLVRDALRHLKYEQALWLAPDLAQLLTATVRSEYHKEAFDVVVPVPLHAMRRRERGFNQSGLLAQALAQQLESTFMPRVLKRIRPTISQTNLTARDRLSNVSGVFQVKKSRAIVDRKVLLVDDVMTTGATVNACAKELKKHGATSVHVITVARG